MKATLISLGVFALFLASCQTSSIAYKAYGPVSVDTTQALTLDESIHKNTARYAQST